MSGSDKRTGIDLVYLWVDGSDPKWLAKRNAFTGNLAENTAINCKGRYTDNDELKYSLRSVEKYAPWIRKIFIVTDDQTPSWLKNMGTKVIITDVKDILPQECLPCFNSVTIEHFLYKIPELSERFLLSCDDMFINKPVLPDTFFAADGFPIVCLNRKPFKRLVMFWREHIRRKPLLHYSKTIANAAELIKKRYGVYYNAMPHHNIDAYLKSDCQRVAENIFKKELEVTFANHIRSYNDIHRIIYQYAALAEKRGHLRYTNKRESFYVRIYKKEDYKRLEKYSPTFFCANDSQHVNDDDRLRLKACLNDYFPEKSSFEK